MFQENFEPYAKAGDEVLYICFSTGIAGTFQAANLAKEAVLEDYPDFKITIIDSKCASMGFGLVVSKLLQMQKNGADNSLNFIKFIGKNSLSVKIIRAFNGNRCGNDM